jgi:signal transduction histidine kinase
VTEPRARIRPGRIRRRLTVAFVLVGGLSTGALALGSYLLVRHSRLQDSSRTALAQSTLNVRVAERTLRGRPGDVRTLITRYAARGDFVTVVERSGRIPPGRLAIPHDLRALVDAGRIGYERETAAGTPYVVVGEPVPNTGTALYFFYDESRLWSDLHQLETVLAGAWAVLAALSALVGVVLARRLLAPVAAAGAAARSLAEGMLDTRLPQSGADEFGAWAASFNEMADALQGKIAALTEAQARERRFTADVAHELRTPLTALVAEAELLQAHAGRMPGDVADVAGLVSHDVGRLRRLVDDLLEISRLEAGAESVRAERVDAGDLVAALVAARGWNGAVTVAGAAPPLVTDRRRLERILANLIGNALEHGGGRARVRLGGDGRDALVTVADDGPGIPEAFRAHLFDRFSKADPSRTSAGSGLGLAIARENAVLLGGAIAVESAPGAGATFTLRLPVTTSLPAGADAVTAVMDH